MRVWLINFGYTLANGQEYETLQKAKEAGIKAGFEFAVITKQNSVLGSWSPIGGWREPI